jgi:hypothetical protein
MTSEGRRRSMRAEEGRTAILQQAATADNVEAACKKKGMDPIEEHLSCKCTKSWCSTSSHHDPRKLGPQKPGPPGCGPHPPGPPPGGPHPGPPGPGGPISRKHRIANQQWQQWRWIYHLMQ